MRTFFTSLQVFFYYFLEFLHITMGKASKACNSGFYYQVVNIEQNLGNNMNLRNIAIKEAVIYRK